MAARVPREGSTTRAWSLRKSSESTLHGNRDGAARTNSATAGLKARTEGRRLALLTLLRLCPARLVFEAEHKRTETRLNE